MKSVYAVSSQILLSGSNYLIFLLFFRFLPTEEFIGFSTAVALNMIANAIAEGGISYVAPRELALNAETRKSIASSFILMSLVLYLGSLWAGYHIWNLVSDDPLNRQWVLAYALFFCPALLMPPWLTCWSMGLKDVIAIGIVRTMALVFVLLHPGTLFTALSGFVFLLFTIGILIRLNKKVSVLGVPNVSALKQAMKKLFEVFLSKTSSYAVYSTTPMVVSAVFGSYTASLYIAGERIKSMYATLFYPVIQSIYLSRFQSKEQSSRNKRSIGIVGAMNLLATVLLLLIIHWGILNHFTDRFSNIQNLWVYVLAAFLSVNTSILLFFKVLPAGNYQLFRKSTYFQLSIFILLFLIMGWKQIIQPEYVLLLGEFAIFAAIVFLIMHQKRKGIVYAA
ncbi:MAG TPA: hypothetical protein PLK12_05575 [Prolixibacteraceae bacterium]|nr:hypothetical protein [Prolixibacteraceae bacterium]